MCRLYMIKSYMEQTKIDTLLKMSHTILHIRLLTWLTLCFVCVCTAYTGAIGMEKWEYSRVSGRSNGGVFTFLLQ